MSDSLDYDYQITAATDRVDRATSSVGIARRKLAEAEDELDFALANLWYWKRAAKPATP